MLLCYTHFLTTAANSTRDFQPPRYSNAMHMMIGPSYVLGVHQDCDGRRPEPKVQGERSRVPLTMPISMYSRMLTMNLFQSNCCLNLHLGQNPGQSQVKQEGQLHIQDKFECAGDHHFLYILMSRGDRKIDYGGFSSKRSSWPSGSLTMIRVS